LYIYFEIAFHKIFSDLFFQGQAPPKLNQIIMAFSSRQIGKEICGQNVAIILKWKHILLTEQYSFSKWQWILHVTLFMQIIWFQDF